MIAVAKQDGNRIEVWDENGNFLYSRIGDQLEGFTSNTVAIRNGSRVEVWDENGNFKFSR